MAKKVKKDFLSDDALAKRLLFETFLKQKAANGRTIGSCKRGVYAFYDFDHEPIYVGLTLERLSARLRRHMTGQRSDGVVNRVIDPVEVAHVEVYPMWDLEDMSAEEAKPMVQRAERTLYLQVIENSTTIKAVLNEKVPEVLASIDLPEPVTADLIPAESRKRLSHKDVRLAQRAAKTAELAAIVRERQVSLGLRQTLVTQARRLLLLAEARDAEVRSQLTPEQIVKETVGSSESDV